MTVIRYFLAALMAAFALLQLNDPDPLVWVVAYGLVAVSIAVPARWRWCPRITWLTAGVLLTLALVALPGFFDYLTSGEPGSIAAEMSAAPYVEPAREFLGLVIAGAILAGIRTRDARGASPD